MTLKNGDYLEFNFRGFILENFPSYEEVWKLYVGHDGNGKALQIPSLDKELEKKRIDFSQLSYTILESIIGLKILSEKDNSINHENVVSYVDMINNYIAFQGHIGRIHDNIKEILNTIQSNGSQNQLLKFESFYKKRNQILHGKKIPIRIEKSLIMVPELSNRRGQTGNEWNSSYNWDDINRDDYKFLDDFLKDTLNELLQLINSFYFYLLTPLKTTFKGKSVNWDKYQTNESCFITPSGGKVYSDDFDKTMVFIPSSGSTTIY